MLVTTICLLVAVGVAGLGWRGITEPQTAEPVQPAAPTPTAPATSAAQPSPTTTTKPQPKNSQPKKTTTAKPKTSKKPAPAEIPRSGSGDYTRANISTIPAVKERGQVITFAVKVEKEVPVNANAAATFIAKTFADKRSWGGDGSLTFVFKPTGDVDVTAYIATPETTDDECAPLNTRGELSCRNGNKVMLNAVRWAQGVPHFNGDLTTYRQYLVNHEFGHYIGYGHVHCQGKGKLAPVMQTQTVGLEGCRKNAWPAPNR